MSKKFNDMTVEDALKRYGIPENPEVVVSLRRIFMFFENSIVDTMAAIAISASFIEKGEEFDKAFKDANEEIMGVIIDVIGNLLVRTTDLTMDDVKDRTIHRVADFLKSNVVEGADES